MIVKKNDNIILKTENMTNEGSAVGHYQGLAVFVRGAVPGDTVNAHIIKVTKNYAVAKLTGVIDPSPSRILSDCPASDSCGGCSLRNMTYDEELRYKRSRVEEAVSRIAHLDIPVKDVVRADNINFYRNKAQYPVKIINGELIAGFYAYKSHRIVPCGDCRLQPPEFLQCLEAFAEWVKQSGVTSYDESSGTGLLRHIYLRKAFATGSIMVCAVINGSSVPNANLLVSLLSNVGGVDCICLNCNTQRSNVILGKDTVTLWGSGFITDVLLNKRFIISPNSFYQINHDQCEKLYLQAKKYATLTGSETVVDLYCGAGTIGLSMADDAKRIIGVEIVPDAIENAKQNARLNNISNAEFFCGDAVKLAKKLSSEKVKADVLILDPPRKGCKAELFDTVAQMSPDRIVYVSCDPATLARDLAVLSQKGYAASQITPVDMFPRTPHIEVVTQIVRKNIG